MNKIILMTLPLFIFSSSVHALPSWMKNKAAEKQKLEKYYEAIDAIPIYDGKPEGKYEMLGYVRGQDLLTQKKNAIFRQVRGQAYKMNADAITEFTCKQMVKSAFQNCTGYAIKFTESGN